MPLFSSIQIGDDRTLYFSFHIGGDDAEFILEEASIGYSTTNILDIISEEIIEKIEKFIGENLERIIEGNR